MPLPGCLRPRPYFHGNFGTKWPGLHCKQIGTRLLSHVFKWDMGMDFRWPFLCFTNLPVWYGSCNSPLVPEPIPRPGSFPALPWMGPVESRGCGHVTSTSPGPQYSPPELLTSLGLAPSQAQRGSPKVFSDLVLIFFFFLIFCPCLKIHLRLLCYPSSSLCQTEHKGLSCSVLFPEIHQINQVISQRVLNLM